MINKTKHTLRDEKSEEINVIINDNVKLPCDETDRALHTFLLFS